MDAWRMFESLENINLQKPKSALSNHNKSPDSRANRGFHR